MNTLLTLLILVAVAFQIWVTVRMWRSELYLRTEKWAQFKLIWLLPIVGAVMVHSVLAEEDHHDHHGDKSSSHWLG